MSWYIQLPRSNPTPFSQTIGYYTCCLDVVMEVPKSNHSYIKLNYRRMYSFNPDIGIRIQLETHLFMAVY